MSNPTESVKKSSEPNGKKTWAQHFLQFIERAGNALPDPAVLFLILTAVVLLASALMNVLGVEALHPVKKEAVKAVNLLSVSGLHLLLSDLVKNFSGFAPMGTVLVTMLGFSVAEKSGLLGAVLRILVFNAPRALIVPAVLLAGVLSHTASDMGYVLLIPLAAMTFHSVGMNPIAGIAVCFAGVSGGFSANFLLSSIDPLLSGVSQEAARIIDPNYTVLPVSNWYFMAASSVLIIGMGTLIANFVTIPFLGEYKGSAQSEEVTKATREEKKGLTYAGIVIALFFLFLFFGLVPEGGFLRSLKDGSVLGSPVFPGIVAIIFFVGLLAGTAFGIGAGTIKNHADIVKAMQESMRNMAPYLVLAFFAAQFISLFNASNIGMILAVKGAEFFKGLGLGPYALILGFIPLVCVLDLFIGSASAKWVLLAPVFIPMFMLLGIAPELTQTSYRIGDSVVNIISPLMPYLPLILILLSKYDPKAKIGTIMALMLPYTIGFAISWSLLLLGWMLAGLPVGPGSQLWFQVPTP
jgi:aminobenzoyl-glutamate transport protein